MKYLVILMSMSSLLIFSCKKESSSFTDTPIIEAYLVPGNCFSILVKRQIPFAESVTYSSDDLDELTIMVTLNGTNYTLEGIGDGVYVDSSLIVQEGDAYTIHFQFNNKAVSAYTYIPSKPSGLSQSETSIYLTQVDSTTGPGMGGTMPDPIEITWENSDLSYYLVVAENMESDPEPVVDFGDDAPPPHLFRKSPTNNSSDILNPRDFEYFGTYRIIVYHVLPDYASLYDQTGSSSQNLSNPSTSITNGYGIFTGLNADTLYIEVKKQ